MSWLKKMVVAAERLVFGRAAADLRWWHRRVRRRGVRSVYNLAHTESELLAVTRRQIALLFPILQRHLRGDETLIVDFGCGPGRFTPDLAELAKARVVGVDPIQQLLDAAPQHPAVEYRPLTSTSIPLPSDSVDVVWICLVLMTITDPATLATTIAELRRVLRPGGLVFLVENTEPRSHRPHLCYRSVADYTALLSWARLQHVCDYNDASERISVMVGRAS